MNLFRSAQAALPAAVLPLLVVTLASCSRPGSDIDSDAKSSVTPNGQATQNQADPNNAGLADPTAAQLVLGEYACDENHWDVAARRMVFQPRGYFTLHPGGRYRWLDDGGEGSYQFNADSSQIAWTSGPLAEKQPQRSSYRRNQTTTQIDILFTENVEWSCGHNL